MPYLIQAKDEADFLKDLDAYYRASNVRKEMMMTILIQKWQKHQYHSGNFPDITQEQYDEARAKGATNNELHSTAKL